MHLKNFNFTPPFYTVLDVLTDRECLFLEKYLALFDDQLQTATINSNKKPSDERKSLINFHKFNNSKNKWIFEKINNSVLHANHNFWNYDLHGYDFFQYTVYTTENSHYNWHNDIGDYNSFFGERKISISILVNDEFTGGVFKINNLNRNQEIDVTLKKGQAIIFPSFVPHCVTPVTAGTRKSVVAWICGPQFK